MPKTLSDELHPHRHSNKNQRCHNSTVRINTECFLRVACVSSVQLFSGTHENSNSHATLLTSKFRDFPESSEHMSCAHRQNHLQSCSMCLKCVSSERDLSHPQMKCRYIQASCLLTRNYRRSSQLWLLSTRVIPYGLRVFNCREQFVSQLELVKKYTTSWIMDVLHSRSRHTKVSLRNKYTQVTASRQSATVTALRDHPALTSVCLSSCWQSRQEFLRTRMDLELLPSTALRVAFLAPFH